MDRRVPHVPSGRPKLRIQSVCALSCAALPAGGRFIAVPYQFTFFTMLRCLEEVARSFLSSCSAQSTVWSDTRPYERGPGNVCPVLAQTAACLSWNLQEKKPPGGILGTSWAGFLDLLHWALKPSDILLFHYTVKYVLLYPNHPTDQWVHCSSAPDWTVCSLQFEEHDTSCPHWTLSECKQPGQTQSEHYLKTNWRGTVAGLFHLLHKPKNKNEQCETLLEFQDNMTVKLQNN